MSNAPESSPAYRGRVKYDERLARNYQQRKPHKHRAELRLINRALTLIPRDHTLLDAPCGGGRVTIHLAQKGYNVSGADLSDAMLKIARQNIAESGLACPVERQDLERLTYPDRHFDTIVCFRLFHHFPSAEIRQRVVIELCRVATHTVVLSYFSPWSLTSLKRKWRAARGRKSEKYPTPRAEVEGYFAHAGFRLVKDFAQTPLLHTLRLAVFERIEKSASLDR